MKKQLYITVILTFVGALCLTSCSPILSGLYGIKEIKTIDENTIYRYSKKFNIPLEDSYEMDSSYLSFINSFDTVSQKALRRNHSQPLQARYYDKAGQLQSFHINCHAGGFPNLMWNRNNVMSTFIPGQQTPVDSIMPLDRQLKYLNPLSQTKKTNIDKYDYVVIVYWNRFMGRQSKRLIRFVQDNSKLASDQNVKILYVNNDNIFAGQ